MALNTTKYPSDYSKIKSLIVLFLLLSSFSFLTGCSLLANSDAKKQAVNGTEIAPVPVLKTKQSQSTTIAAKKSTRLPSMQLVQNTEVKKELNDFLTRKGTVNKALKKADPHLPTIKEIFTDEGIPQDLTNVALVESGFNSQARSPMGATGMWQFMKSTARYYGLKIELEQDQRKDIVLSSLAAARHLRDLYNKYEDWYLALAAYNMGAGGLERAMIKAGTRDFWELARKGFIPKETARYVPRILAAAIIMKDPESHGFTG